MWSRYVPVPVDSPNRDCSFLMEPNLIGWHAVGLDPGQNEQPRFSESITTSPTGYPVGSMKDAPRTVASTTVALEAQTKSQSTPSLKLCFALTYIYILIYAFTLTRTCAYTLHYLGSKSPGSIIRVIQVKSSLVNITKEYLKTNVSLLRFYFVRSRHVRDQLFLVPVRVPVTLFIWSRSW
jgi:hypothetical protein